MIREMSLLGGKDRILPSIEQTYARVCLSKYPRSSKIYTDRQRTK